jgi:hypothetical protein
LDSIFLGTSFQFGKYPDGTFRFVFREENPNGNVEKEIPTTRCTPWHCIMKSAPLQIHCSFPLFQRLQKLQEFLEMFSNAFQALLSVEFKFMLKSCS